MANSGPSDSWTSCSYRRRKKHLKTVKKQESPRRLIGARDVYGVSRLFLICVRVWRSPRRGRGSLDFQNFSRSAAKSRSDWSKRRKPLCDVAARCSKHFYFFAACALRSKATMEIFVGTCVFFLLLLFPHKNARIDVPGVGIHSDGFTSCTQSRTPVQRSSARATRPPILQNCIANVLKPVLRVCRSSHNCLCSHAPSHNPSGPTRPARQPSFRVMQ